MRIDHLEHRFVSTVPGDLEAGVLYVSIEYDTTIHLCACGCRNQVVLPLHPTAWRLLYDGAAVSMWPSVGNWSFPCRSHYWIKDGRIQWSGAWSDTQIAAGRQRTLSERGVAVTPSVEAEGPAAQGLWPRVKRGLRRALRRSRSQT